MYTRLLTSPNHSSFLFGPRGVGKSTWLKTVFGEARRYDLLDASQMLRLNREPWILSKELAALPEGTTVIIDEVQKAPGLLDEVQRLIEDRKLRFILSGSSARKLKRGGANMLAGRARIQKMYPLVSAEVGAEFNLEKAIRFGMLPLALTADDPEAYLQAYATVYLQEEIKNEALTRNIGQFARFLEIAARQNAQVTNTTGIARDGMVPRQSVQGYFEILTDTLMGFWLQPWKLKRSTRQVSHPKFYFFDPGVVRALTERLPYPLTSEEAGPLFETLILSEIRAYVDYRGLGYPLFFWSSPDEVEVDLFCETSRGFVALELKSSTRWDSRFNRGLKRISSELGPGKVRCLGVYAGENEARFDDITVMPAPRFLESLWAGKIIA